MVQICVAKGRAPLLTKERYLRPWQGLLTNLGEHALFGGSCVILKYSLKDKPPSC